MDIYLVGGAVRDQLLGYPVKEHDWVVVGATPQLLLQQGYQQVGRDFPVFLHPKTRDEYALARMERKQAPGYHGFTCNFNPNVTLEEDLLRRDLTINAMAQDEQGRLIDPYNGHADLKARRLCHVSPAFSEDPVRVLRVARFMARYYHLGFRVAEETMALMLAMVRQGELNYLVPERVWQEWERSLLEKNPEQFILTLRACGALRVMLPELDALFGIPDANYPDVDVGISGLSALQKSVDLTVDPLVRFAAFAHELGKVHTPMNQWPWHDVQQEQGVRILDALARRVGLPAAYRDLTRQVLRYQSLLFNLEQLGAEAIVEVFEGLDVFRRPIWFEQLLVLCQITLACKLRQHASEHVLLRWRALLQACVKIEAQPLIAAGIRGAEIKRALHDRRVEVVLRMIEW